MKLVLDQKTFYNNLRLLAGISDTEGTLAGVVIGSVSGGVFSMLAGTTYNLVVIEQEVIEVDEDGQFAFDPSLVAIVKMVKASVITMNINKKISITAENGFKASMALKEKVNLAIYDKIAGWHNAVSKDFCILNTNEVKELAKVAEGMTPFNGSRWVDVGISSDGVLVGSTHRSEIFSIEEVRFNDTEIGCEVGSRVLATLNPSQLLSVLSFCGNKVRMSVGAPTVPVCVTDPDNSAWYGLLTTLDKPIG